MQASESSWPLMRSRLRSSGPQRYRHLGPQRNIGLCGVFEGEPDAAWGPSLWDLSTSWELTGECVCAFS